MDNLAQPPIQNPLISENDRPSPGLISYGWMQWFYLLRNVVNAITTSYTLLVSAPSGTSSDTWLPISSKGSISKVYAVRMGTNANPITVTIKYLGVTIFTGNISVAAAGSVTTFTIPTTAVAQGTALDFLINSVDINISVLFTIVQTS